PVVVVPVVRNLDGAPVAVVEVRLFETGTSVGAGFGGDGAPAFVEAEHAAGAGGMNVRRGGEQREREDQKYRNRPRPRESASAVGACLQATNLGRGVAVACKQAPTGPPHLFAAVR